MSERVEHRAVFVGEGTLLIRAAEIWRARGHAIVAIVTTSSAVARWAEQREIVALGPNADRSALALPAHEFLFSVGNAAGVPAWAAELPTSRVVHYHDGPFPRFAGFHPAVWAIAEGAARFGITWLAANRDGEPEVITTRELEIGPDETALTLGTRCRAAAAESFEAIVGAIESGALATSRCDEVPRRFYERTRRPWALGHLDFSRPARELARLVRALDFGAYENPLALPKIECGGRVLAVSGAERLDGERGGRAGEVIDAGDGFVDVATGEGIVRLSRITTLEGDAPDVAPAVGDVLGWPDAADARALERVGLVLASHEESFVRSLEGVAPTSITAERARREEPASWDEVRLAEVPATVRRAEWVSALAALVARLSSSPTISLAYADETTLAFWRRAPRYVASQLPMSLTVAPDASMSELRSGASAVLADLGTRGGYARDLPARRPDLARAKLSIGVVFGGSSLDVRDGLELCLVPDSAGGATLEFDAARVSRPLARSIAARLVHLLEAALAEPRRPLAELLVVRGEERRRLAELSCGPSVEIEPGTVVDRFEAAVDRDPSALALVTGDARLTYRELDALANEVASRLVEANVPEGAIVGLSVARGAATVYGALGIWKAGCAYLPLDPSYPEERLQMMLDDAGVRVVLVDRASESLFDRAERVRIDDVTARAARVRRARGERDLAYVIYTSGSTGRPKGVMVEHGNVLSFFAGMDERVPRGEGEAPVWLAVTSLSFDISVLELFYTLCRGFVVVVASDAERALAASDEVAPSVEFGLFYWGNDGGRGREKYRLLLEGAKIADRAGFNAVWTPERHFHAFGGPYPNPAVTGAAVAAVTEHVEVRAGSCVLPLHHPARVAEEWAVVDNLTRGRVGVAFASGWQPDDFVLRPDNAPPRHRAAMLESMETVRRLWRGESVSFPKGDGELHEVVTMPRPVQAELPVWLTTAGNPQTWIDAAKAGANVLTHLLGQSLAEVAEKVAIYREALAESGRDPSAYRVSLMLHTFVAESRDEARRVVEAPLKAYLESAAGLIKNYAWAFPAFKRPTGVTSAASLDLSRLDPEELEGVLDYAFHRYFDESGLFGTVEDCLARAEDVRRSGVDEIACLVDFGVETDVALASIERLADVVRGARAARPASNDRGLAALVVGHGVTHLQCTPSMARMLLEHRATRAALGRVRHLFIGGEALHGELVAALRAAAPDARVVNMYGPTETTVWSSTALADEREEIASIGAPIANTRLYVMDERGELLPPGVAGELTIGGAGVTRGYLNRPDLTSERFVDDPFSPGARLYRTGDLAEMRADGTVRFLGRIDHQVKIRGHRIELGEIEARALDGGRVREAVAIAREDRRGDVRLVLYVTGEGADLEEATRAHLGRALPAFMMPSHVVRLAKMPLTPNAKIDRAALPRPEDVASPRAEYKPPTNEIEAALVAVYAELFGIERVGLGDDFFALGGHSLLAVQAHRRLSERLSVKIAVTDVFRFPVVRELARHLAGASATDDTLAATKERASHRRRAMMRRRGTSRT